MWTVQVILVFTGILLCIGSGHVGVQGQASCIDDLDAALRDQSSDVCEADIKYMKCLIKQFELHLLGVGWEAIIRYDNRVQSELHKQGVICEIDILQVAFEARREDLEARLNATDIREQGFDNATDFRQCRDAFIYSASRDAGLTCDIGTAYAKCVARVSGLYLPELQRDALLSFERDALVTLHDLGTNCSLDVETMMVELRDEVLGNMTTTIENVETSIILPVTSPSSNQGFGFVEAISLGDCMEAASRAVSTGRVTCETVTSYMKCLVRFLDLRDANVPRLTAKSFENQVLQKLGATDLGCSVDVRAIIEELLAERNSEGLNMLTTTTVETILSMVTEATTEPATDTQSSQVLFDSEVDRRTSPTAETISSTVTETTVQPTTSSESGQGTEDDVVSRLTKTVVETIRSSMQGLTTTPSPTTTTASSPAPSFEDATTVAECTNALYFHGFTLAALNCDTLTSHAKCIIRVLGLHLRDDSLSNPEQIQTQLQVDWDMLGLGCTVDIQKIFQELRGEQGTDNSECVMNTENACANKIDGDYPLCDSECQTGRYVTCSSNYHYVRDCPQGWYLTPRGNYQLAKLVFDPVTGHCLTKSTRCPRYLDQLVLE